MQDLEGEDRRAERRAEQHGEPCGHPGDREHPRLANAELAAPPHPGPDRTGGLHQRCLRADRAPRADPEQRDRDQCAQVAEVATPAAHVDVVDEQLDVPGIAECHREHADRRAHRDEHDQMLG